MIKKELTGLRELVTRAQAASIIKESLLNLSKEIGIYEFLKLFLNWNY